MSSRGGVGYSAVVVLLVALGAAVEVYDEPSPAELDMDVAYQEDNDIDTGPTIERLRERQLPSMNDVLLYRLVKELQARDARARLLYRTNGREVENAVNHAQRTVYSPINIKDSIHKRLSGTALSFRGNNKTPESIRPQQKWKIKKGKAIGSQMVCYFKLCAFRSPA
ncbi:uncharacterized protein ACR2FA_003320 [Aphomia sociella]